MRVLQIIVLFFSVSLSAQQSVDQVLKKYNKNTIPYITVNDLKNKKVPVVLDARQWKEYQVSHLPNAIYVGHEAFKAKNITSIISDKNTPLVVYCSIGVRSEQIAEKVKALGYTEVYNLYGGIFEWKNHDGIVVDDQNKPTENVHAFSKEWSKYLLKGKKIY